MARNGLNHESLLIFISCLSVFPSPYNVAVTQMSVLSYSYCLHRLTAHAMQKERHESNSASCVTQLTAKQRNG